MEKQRIESVDILRGITIAAMILVNTPGTWSYVYPPLLHAEWHGLTPTDLIFPFFLFIVGISIHFAYKSKPKSVSTYKKIFIRSLKLIGLGLFLAWFLPYFPFFKNFETLRFPGVLQRIGIVFLFSSILYVNFNWKILLSVAITILLFYWFFLGYVPLPDGSLPTYDRAPNNWANYVDLNVLGKHMWKPDYDPEGILSTFPAIASCLSGILIAKLLESSYKLKNILLTSVSLLFFGYLLHRWFPINKAIWSSSFVLVTSGWASLLLAIIYYVVDVKKIRFGAFFKYIGMNAIVIYFLSSFISKSFYLTKVNDTENIHSWLFNHLFNLSFIDQKFSSLLYALAVVLCYTILGYYLYRKKMFFKI